MSALIPKSFFPIALTDLHQNIAVAYYSKERHMFMFKLNDDVVGPIEAAKLESFIHVLKDVADMKGRFHPLQGGPDGGNSQQG